MGSSNGKLALVTPVLFTFLFRLQYDGVTSLSEPPNSEAFDPSKRRQSLMVGGRPSLLAPSASPQDLQLFAGMLSDVRALAHPEAPPAPATPKRAAHPTLDSTTTPPGRHVTPNSLNRFLRHAQTEMGINEAMSYESPLRKQAYEPDILHKVSDRALEALGIPGGHIIRMKEASHPWFTGPLFLQDRGSSPTPPPHQVDYERRWSDAEGKSTGSSRFTGPPMVADVHGEVLEEGLELWWKCEARNDWFPIPQGMTVITNGNENVDWH